MREVAVQSLRAICHEGHGIVVQESFLPCFARPHSKAADNFLAEPVQVYSWASSAARCPRPAKEKRLSQMSRKAAANPSTVEFSAQKAHDCPPMTSVWQVIRVA